MAMREYVIVRVPLTPKEYMHLRLIAALHPSGQVYGVLRDQAELPAQPYGWSGATRGKIQRLLSETEFLGRKQEH